jgi:hypothetical protein
LPRSRTLSWAVPVSREALSPSIINV